MPVSYAALISRILYLITFQDANIYSVDSAFIRDNAKKVLAASDIDYLKRAQLRGRLFQEGSSTDETAYGAISSVFTEFYVDHKEPFEVLEKFKAKGRWCLGDLLDGHEYLALFSVAPL